MAAGDLITADWEMEYNGVLFGGDTEIAIVQVVGLLDLPDIRSSDRTRLRRNGLLAGDDFAGGRSVTITVEVDGTDGLDAAVQKLQKLSTPTEDEKPLVFQLPGVAGGGKRMIMARPRRRSLTIGREFFYRLPTAVVQYDAADPRIYDANESLASTVLPSAGGGLNFDATFPIVFGAVSVGGSIMATNAGTFPTPPRFSIQGPVTNPRIENLTAGKTLALDINIGATESLVIDVEARTVLLNGTSSRYSAITSASEWWELPPGTSEVRFRAQTYTSSTLTMTWRSAWV